jgi:hypothetical protein
LPLLGIHQIDAENQKNGTAIVGMRDAVSAR